RQHGCRGEAHAPAPLRRALHRRRRRGALYGDPGTLRRGTAAGRGVRHGRGTGTLRPDARHRPAARVRVGEHSHLRGAPVPQPRAAGNPGDTMSVAGSLTQALVWYGVAFALSALLYPAVFRATPGLPDRGLSLAGPLGLLFAVAGPWWLAATGITRFTDTLLVAFPLVIGVALWVWEIRRGEILPYLRRNVATALLWPTVALALFLGYVVFRGFNPDAAYTEKPMDMAMLASAIRATEMPPPDPWFAGEPINYYYLGYVLMAAL